MDINENKNEIINEEHSCCNNQGCHCENKKSKSKIGFIIFYIISVIIALLIGAAGLLLFFKLNPDFIKSEVINTNITKTEKEVTVNENGIADAVDKIYDSVVVVKNYVNGKLYATGTGFFYKNDNNKYYILTNYHVIQGGSSISVVTTDGTETTVNVEGGDKYADIAVLSFESDKEIIIAELGDNSSMRVGDTVFAIGAPLNSDIYSWSVTRGILSGKDRSVQVSTNSNSSTSDWIMTVLQTDTAINSGNSGGPLCNSNGQVIGITNMKLASTGVEGMGFAIPIEEAVSYATQIIEDGEVSRPYIGISMNNVQRETNGNITTAVMVYSVDNNSPAEEAGIKEGDIILAINDSEVTNLANLRYALYKNKPGDTIKVKVLRDDKEKEISVTLR